jgi:beta-glucanase (GH16 family)
MARSPLAALVLALGCGLMPPEEESGELPEPETLPPPGYALVWADEFDGTALDGSVWTPMAGPRHDAISTPDAIDVRGGLLSVTTYTGPDGAHRTGFLTTEGKLELCYGYFEARIRFNSAPGSWCAFWISSPTVGEPKGDPGRAGVEIDVVEHRFTDQGGWDALKDMVALNLNWDGYDEDKQNVQRVLALPDGSPVQGEWHRYGVLWTEAGYTFYVDGMALWQSDAALSHRPQDVRLTCEVDDGGWAGYVPPGGYGPRAASTARMEVDWVRVWQAAP